MTLADVAAALFHEASVVCCAGSTSRTVANTTADSDNTAASRCKRLCELERPRIKESTGESYLFVKGFGAPVRTCAGRYKSMSCETWFRMDPCPQPWHDRHGSLPNEHSIRSSVRTTQPGVFDPILLETLRAWLNETTAITKAK